jgi:O-antigen/teichoic acid export membrane protein
LAEIKNIMSIGMADTVGIGIIAIFWFYMATILDTEQYGEIHYFLGIAGIAYAISLLGTQNTITVLTAKNFKIEPTLYFLTLAITSIAAIILILIFNRLDISLILFGFVINEFSIGYLLGKKKYANYSGYVLTQKCLTMGLGILFYFLFGVDGIIYGFALSYIHFMIIFAKIFNKFNINFPILKSHFSFVRNNYFYSLSNGFRGHFGKLIIVPLLGFSVLGNYALALQIVAVLMMFSNIVFKYLLSQEASNISHDKLKKITILVSIGISALGITLLPLVITSIFPKYILAIDAIRIMSLVVIPSTINILYTSKLLSIENSKTLLIGKLISVLTMIVGIVILGNFLDLIGIAIAFVLSSTVECSYLIYHNKINKGVKTD